MTWAKDIQGGSELTAYRVRKAGAGVRTSLGRAEPTCHSFFVEPSPNPDGRHRQVPNLTP